MRDKWCCLLGSLLIAVLLSVKATVAFSPTRPLRAQISYTNFCLCSTNSDKDPKQPSEMNAEELQVASVEAAQQSVDKAETANTIAGTANTIAGTANTIAAISVAISAVVPLGIAYMANIKMDAMRMEDNIKMDAMRKEDRIFQLELKEREEIFQLELKKLETNTEKKKHDIQALIDAKKGVTPKSLSMSTNQRTNPLNDGAVAWLKKQTAAEQGSSLPWLT